MAHDIQNRTAAYLAGKLSPAEAQQFEADLAEDPALAEEVELQRLEDEAMDELLRQDIEKKIPIWQTSMDEWPEPPSPAEPPAGKTRFSPDALHWALGAVALLSLAGAFWFWTKWQDANAQKTPLEQQIRAEQAEKEDLKSQFNLLQQDLEAMLNPIPLPQKQPTKPLPPETGGGTKSSAPPQASVELPRLAEENLNDLYATIGVDVSEAPEGTRSTSGSSEAALKMYEAGRVEFLKKARNGALIKSNLSQVPASERNLFPYAQAMLAEVYWQEKNYRRALDCYEKYALVDNSPATQWRLLNFRLAAYPYRKAKFWALLSEFSKTDDADYQEKIKALRLDLVRLGISPE